MKPMICNRLGSNLSSDVDYLYQIRKRLRETPLGGGHLHLHFTVSEELALANNEGRPMMAGVAGGLSSDPTASVGLSDAYVVGM